jgi:flavin-dependent dehydrogenase
MHNNEGVGEQIQHDTQKGIIAGIETAAIAANVLKNAWDNRHRPVKVKIDAPGVKEDLDLARKMFKDGKTGREVTEALKQRPEYQKLDGKRPSAGNLYIDSITKSASRKNRANLKVIIQPQKNVSKML